MKGKNKPVVTEDAILDLRTFEEQALRRAVQENNDEEEDKGLPLGGTDSEIREAIKRYEDEIIKEATPQDEPIANRTKSKNQGNIKTEGEPIANRTKSKTQKKMKLKALSKYIQHCANSLRK